MNCDPFLLLSLWPVEFVVCWWNPEVQVHWPWWCNNLKVRRRKGRDFEVPYAEIGHHSDRLQWPHLFQVPSWLHRYCTTTCQWTPAPPAWVHRWNNVYKTQNQYYRLGMGLKKKLETSDLWPWLDPIPNHSTTTHHTTYKVYHSYQTHSLE